MNRFAAPTHQVTPPVAVANKMWQVTEAGMTNSSGRGWKERWDYLKPGLLNVLYEAIKAQHMSGNVMSSTTNIWRTRQRKNKPPRSSINTLA